VPDAAAGFSSTAVLPTLEEACAQAGLSSDGAELLRLGENAIYQLAADPVVVRIARSADRLPRVRRELCVARWLAASNVPAVHVIEEIDQPFLVHDRPVTFWRTVTGGDPVPDHVDLARLLAAFHGQLERAVGHGDLADYGLIGEQLLIGEAAVVQRHLRRLVAERRHDLRHARTVLGQHDARVLAQAVGGVVGMPGPSQRFADAQGKRLGGTSRNSFGAFIFIGVLLRSFFCTSAKWVPS